MLKQHSFSNPFSGIKEKFQKSGRSNSAPGAYDIYIDRFWSLCVCVCPTNQTHFVLGRLREHMFSSCFSDILCLIGFCIFCSPLQIAWLLFLFTKDQDHWMKENIFAKLDINVCVFVFAFFVCLCRLHACCYPFAKDQWEKTSLRCLT